MTYSPMSGVNGRLTIDSTVIDGTVDYTVDEQRKRYDTTAMGDSSESSVPGLPAGKITCTVLKNKNAREVETFNDGQPHTILLECDRDAADPDPIHNWNGMGTLDISTKGGVGDAIKQTITITAAPPGIVSSDTLPG